MGDAVRLSPSGPDLANSGGATFVPGTGARLRLVQETTEVDPTANTIDTTERVIGSTFVASPSATQLVCELDNPNPELNYRAAVRCDVFSTVTTAIVNVSLKLEASVDDGTTWATLSNNEHGVDIATTGIASPDGEHADSGGFRQISLERPLTLGTGFGIVAQTTVLKVRATIKGDQAGAFGDSRNVPAGNYGTVLLELEECF